MDTKHTPGPWIVDYTGNRVLARDERETIICILGGSTRNPDVARDARLIAAAPELLEALRKARSFIEAELDARGPDISGVALDALDAADAAIAKTTGGA